MNAALKNMIARLSPKKTSTSSTSKSDEHSLTQVSVGSLDTINNQKKKRTTKKNNHSSKKKSSSCDIPNGIGTEQQTPNEKAVSQFIKIHNRHSSYDETMSCFASPDVMVKFEDDNAIPASAFAAECQNAFKSFPNFSMHCDCIKEERHFDVIKQEHTNRVVVEDVMVTGTHTGEPYGFAYFPPVPTSNKMAVNGPERVFYTIDKDNKISLLEIISLGDASGPAGFYSQVGGDLTLPPPPSSSSTSGEAADDHQEDAPLPTEDARSKPTETAPTKDV